MREGGGVEYTRRSCRFPALGRVVMLRRMEVYKCGVGWSGFFAFAIEVTMKRRAAEDGSEVSVVEDENDGMSMVKSRSAGDGSVICKNPPKL